MKQIDLKRIEFFGAIIIYIGCFVWLISNTRSQYDQHEWLYFYENKITYSSFYNYFLPEFYKLTSLFLAFFLLNFYVIPSLTEKKKVLLKYLMILATIGVLTVVIGVARTYSQAYELLDFKTLQHAYNHIFFQSFYYSLIAVALIVTYAIVKLMLFRVIYHKYEDKKQKRLVMDVLAGLGIWLAGLIFFVSNNESLGFVWTIISFAAIIVYAYVMRLVLPQSSFKVYFKKFALFTLLLAVPVGLISLAFFDDVEVFFVMMLIHLGAQTVVTLPLAWNIYHYRRRREEEITGLKTELGKSDASLSFLKSQINPHFLFNALNTLYGTALQERAERTSEGIQKLGDMMRFMLHENTKDKILLVRDIDYLNNYIALQKLRISNSADIAVEIEIQEEINGLEITPMLLIPFVENAFKHGLSLLQPSYIKILLQTKEDVLYFDVSNSIYKKDENDPERTKSGIGLENVKQRLKLLYPNKHELIIRESVKEFFIHLTVNLSK